MSHGRTSTHARNCTDEWSDRRSNGADGLGGRSVADVSGRAQVIAAIVASGECLQIDSPQERTIRLCGRGLVVTPTAFWTGPPLLGELPDQPVLLAYRQSP